LRIFTNTWFSRFARKEKIPVSALIEAAQRADNGQIDADLGGGVIKQRIARAGEGKSKGFRSILLLSKGERCFFVFGFPKSGLDNIRDDEEEQFKKMAKLVLALTDAQLSVLLTNGQFEEVPNDKKIPQ